MLEVSGDSSRDGCWALVRLRIDGDRIIDADADGLETDLRRLSLLEAAAVGGETLAVDGPCRRGDERRRRQRRRAPAGGPGSDRSDAAPVDRSGGTELRPRLLL